MAYAVLMRSAAERERRRLQGHIRQRINRRLIQLESEPRPSGVEKLVGRQNSWRIRVGDYRILYPEKFIKKVVSLFKLLYYIRLYA